jgi:hypothetical protein
MRFWGQSENQALVSVLSDVIQGAAKKSAEKTGEAVGQQIARLFVSAAGAAAVGSVVGVGLGVLIEGLIKGADKNRSLLKSLILEPYATGVREIRHALALPPTISEPGFRTDTMRFGIGKLHTALTFAMDAHDEDQQIYILFLIASAEATLPGGLESAAKRLDAMGTILLRQMQETNNRLSMMATPEPMPLDDAEWNSRFVDVSRFGVIAYLTGAQAKKWVERKNAEKTRSRAPYLEKLDTLTTLSDIISDTIANIDRI